MRLEPEKGLTQINDKLIVQNVKNVKKTLIDMNRQERIDVTERRLLCCLVLLGKSA